MLNVTLQKVWGGWLVTSEMRFHIFGPYDGEDGELQGVCITAGSDPRHAMRRALQDVKITVPGIYVLYPYVWPHDIGPPTILTTNCETDDV